MSGLAALTATFGHTVLGSDCAPTEDTVSLCRKMHVPLYFSHDAENVSGCDVFVYSAAIGEDNPELIFAKAHVPNVYTRSEYLGKITETYSESVGVSGTHGKSTVTHMINAILRQSGDTPTLLAGARAVDSEAFCAGDNKTVIYEACEYNRSFLDLKPKVSVILNVEREHVDTYPTLEDAENAYLQFGKKSEKCILSYDNAVCRSLAEKLTECGVKTFYFSLTDKNADAYAENLRTANGRCTFDLRIGKDLTRNVSLSVIGIHNAANALAAALTASVLGKNIDVIAEGLQSFKGIRRRFEYVGSVNGADVCDDYAHHPTEIRATLSAARSLGYKKVICAFQPHTFSRTKEFFCEFTKAFEACDEVIFADVYPAREKNVYGISSKMLAEATKNGKYIPDFEIIAKELRQKAQKGTLILTMGAGKMNEVAFSITENGVKGKD